MIGQGIAQEAVSSLSDHFSDMGHEIEGDLFIDEDVDGQGNPFLYVRSDEETLLKLPKSININGTEVAIIPNDLKGVRL
jgi:hypothetical protein